MKDMNMRTIAVLNLKGGVGKTTTAINMAMILNSIHNKKVLIVDNDMQANTSKFFNVCDYERKSMEDVLRDESVNVREIIRYTDIDGIHVLPANMNLDAAAVDLLLDRETEQNTKLRKALDQVKHTYDFCIIDCPPGIGINVINALTVADDIIVPVKIDKHALDGMQDLEDIIVEVKANYNSDLKLMACLVTMFKKNPVNESGEKILKESEYATFDTHIRYSEKINELTFHEGTSILELSPRSAAARDYKKFVNEYLEYNELSES